METFLLLPDHYLIGATVWILLGVGCLYGVLVYRRRCKRLGHRLWFSGVAISIWITLAALTSAEFAFALLYDETDSIMLTNAAKRWVDIHVQYNESGFRDTVQLQSSPLPGHKRIAFAGDSFTFGHGIKNVEDRFTNILHERMKAKTSGKVAVANIGLLGADIDRIIEVVYRQFERGVQIDTVVYVYCLNDVDRLQPEISDSKFWEIGRSRPSFILFRDTYLFNFLYFRIQQARLPAIRDYFGFVKDFYDDDGMEGVTTRLREFRALCERHDSELRVVIFPFVHNLGSDYPFTEVHQKLVDACQQENIPVFDLKPVLEARTEDGLTVNPYDAHPNELAHQLAADAILQNLLSDLAE